MAVLSSHHRIWSLAVCCNETATGVQCEAAGGDIAVSSLWTAAARHVMRAVAAILHLKKKRRKCIVFFQSVLRSVIYTMCSMQHSYGQNSGERLTWLNLSVVGICFAGELRGLREEDGVIQSAQEFFFYLLSWRKTLLFWHVWKNSVLFYSSSWNLLDGRGLSHTAVENIPGWSQKVSDLASLVSVCVLSRCLFKQSQQNRFLTQLWKTLCGCVVAFFLGKLGGSAERHVRGKISQDRPVWSLLQLQLHLSGSLFPSHTPVEQPQKVRYKNTGDLPGYSGLCFQTPTKKLNVPVCGEFSDTYACDELLFKGDLSPYGTLNSQVLLNAFLTQHYLW